MVGELSTEQRWTVDTYIRTRKDPKFNDAFDEELADWVRENWGNIKLVESTHRSEEKKEYIEKRFTGAAWERVITMLKSSEELFPRTKKVMVSFKEKAKEFLGPISFRADNPKHMLNILGLFNAEFDGEEG